MMKRFLVLAKRALALLGIVSTLYFVIGSLVFPDWFYMLFWSGGLASSGYWMVGVDYWLHTPILLITVGTSLVVAILLIRRYRARFLPAIDRLGGLLILGSVTGIMIMAFIVYQYGRSIYGPLQQITTLNSALEQLRATLPQIPTIKAPVDFQYIDKDRVQSLYNQIEPDLVEAQRSVGTSGNMGAKVGVRAGVGEAEVGGSKHQESNSTYQRLEFSPERECVEVMNFLLSHNQARYYTDGRQWINQRVAASFQTGLEQLQKGFDVASKNKIKALPLEQPLGQPLTKEEQAAAEQQLKQYEDEFDAELTSLQGMVIVDGEFTITRSSEGNSLFVERFSDRPRRVDFRLTAPSTPELSRIISIGRTHLKVFGTVLKALGDDGAIEIRPIAVY